MNNNGMWLTGLFVWNLINTTAIIIGGLVLYIRLDDMDQKLDGLMLDGRLRKNRERKRRRAETRFTGTNTITGPVAGGSIGQIHRPAIEGGTNANQ